MESAKSFTELTSEAVARIVQECLFKEGEDTSKAVIANGVMMKMGFHPERLDEHRAEILSLLLQLPEQFQNNKGGGWSFLNACIRADGFQWGEHRDIDALLCLGLATKYAKLNLPREMWKMFPGGMPYFTVYPE